METRGCCLIRETAVNFDLASLPSSAGYKLLVGLVAPRPIALITSIAADGSLNAAPFSAYNYLSTDPPMVGVGVANRSGEPSVPKDTAQNIAETGEFVINVVTEDLAEAMNLCAIDFPRGENELYAAGLTTAPSQKVKVPRIAQAHAALECRLHSILEVSAHSRIILGQVVGVYAEDRFVDPAGPYIKAEELLPIGRMNGLGNYVRTRDAFFTLDRVRYEDWKDGKRG
jgi:flavin reductase (DIM6/NTAB) family NADH-FMN oxidoreductase RutF